MGTLARTLPLDVVDMLLASSPDYATLMSAITVCKTFYRVFQEHAAGIMREVATNFYGGRQELVLEAIRTIGVNNDILCWATSHQGGFPSVLGTLFNDDHLRQRPLTRDEAKELCKRVEDACALEVLYSTRRKDSRTRNKSLLSETESRNFHLALHRLEMIMCLSRQPHAGSFQWRESRTRIHLVYRRFSTEEVLHIHELFCFLCNRVAEVSRYFRQPSINIKSATIIIGIAHIMSVMRDPTAFEFPKKVPKKVVNIAGDLESILSAEASTTASRRPIVLEVDEPAMSCQVCGCDSRGALWNSSNWHELPDYFRLDHLIYFLPPRVVKNAHEVAQLRTFLGISGAGDSVTYTTFDKVLSALFLMRWDDSLHTSPNMTPETWACANCLDRFIAARFRFWWGLTKAEVKDCTLGFQCLHQVRSIEHAMMHNHVCPSAQVAYERLTTAVFTTFTADPDGGDNILQELDSDTYWSFAWRAKYDPDPKALDRNNQHVAVYGQQLRWAMETCTRQFSDEIEKLNARSSTSKI